MDIRWQLNVAETLLKLEARQRAIIQVLVKSGNTTVSEFNDLNKQIEESEYFKTELDKISKLRTELEKPFDLGELFK